MTDYQKYINALRKCANEHDNDKTPTFNIIVSDLCRDTANLLEKVEQEPKWIPVSERLPETDGRYLAYIVNKYDDKLQYIMTCNYSVYSYWKWFPDDECASDNVVAWMPLPKPYAAESEET